MARSLAKIFRGDIFLAQLDPTVGRGIKKTRPVVVVSNDANNEMAGTVTVVPLTSQCTDRIRHFEVLILHLDKPSKAKVDQVRTLDRSRIFKKLGQISQADQKKNESGFVGASRPPLAQLKINGILT